MFLYNSVKDDDFMILSMEQTEGDDFSPKSGTKDAFACLDDEDDSLDSILNDEQDHEHDLELVIKESTDDEISEPEDSDWKIFPLS